jgi:hypothetical protein
MVTDDAVTDPAEPVQLALPPFENKAIEAVVLSVNGTITLNPGNPGHAELLDKMRLGQEVEFVAGGWVSNTNHQTRQRGQSDATLRRHVTIDAVMPA